MIKPLEILLRSVPLGYFMQRPPLGYYKLLFREGVLKIKDDTGLEKDVCSDTYVSIDGGSPETVYLPHQKIDGGII